MTSGGRQERRETSVPSLTRAHTQKWLAAGITKGGSPRKMSAVTRAPVVFINDDLEETEDIAWKRNRNRKQFRKDR